MKRRWAVIATIFDRSDVVWIDDFVSDDRLCFEKVPVRRAEGSWHLKTSRTTSLRAWLEHLRHARAALATRPDGVLCAFPQLTMCAALLKKIGRRKPIIVAYNFNLGGFPGGLRQRLARWVANEVAAFVVHSPSEIAPYAAYLGVPEDRVHFVPLQRGPVGLTWTEDRENPHILAMGSAHRDYPTLVAAVDALQIPTTIITRAADIETLPQSDHVTYRSGLSNIECLELLSRARLSVTPVSNLDTASGQITFVAAMHLGVPAIATDCPGTEGYIDDGRTGLLVPPFDVDALKDAIAQLWSDPTRRKALAAAGHAEAMARFTEDAAGAAIGEILIAVDPALSSKPVS